MYYTDLLRNRLICSFVSVLLCSMAQAQVVNIENRRIYDDTSGWSGSLDGGFSAVQNKDLLLSASFRPRVQYKNKMHYYLFLTDWNYSKGAEKVYSNAGMIHFRYAYRLQRKISEKKSPWKWESYTQLQYNQLLDQRLRALIGSGLRWKAINSPKYKVFIGTSTYYEYEDIRTSDVLNRDWRWSNYLSWFLTPSPNLSITAATYYQPLWEDFNDFRFMGQYTFSFSVKKRLDLRFEFNNFYDSRPALNVRNWVFSSTFGFRIKLGE